MVVTSINFKRSIIAEKVAVGSNPASIDTLEVFILSGSNSVILKFI